MSLIFEKDYLASLYSQDKQKRMTQIEKLMCNEKSFYSKHINGYPKAIDQVKTPLQIQKDEMIITLYTFAAIHLGDHALWGKLLEKAFPNETWNHQSNVNACTLELEKAISPTNDILESIKPIAANHPVKYARNISMLDKTLESSTNFDAVLTAEPRKVFFECKFTSDISYDTTHCTIRNQIARCIDVGLASMNNRVDDFYFVFITPMRYQEFPGERLYYFKMEQYMNDSMAIALDIPRLNDWYEHKDNQLKLEKLTQHIAWITWEDCLELCLNSQHLTDVQKENLISFYQDRLLYCDSTDLPL
jgi:hypothetical protein